MARKYNKKFKGPFTTTQVYEITMISVRRLKWWDKQNIVKPSALPERKDNQRRLYNLQDIVCLLVVSALRERGVSLKKIKKSIERMEGSGIDHPLARLRVACLAQTLIFKRKDGPFVDPISGQLVIKEALELISHKIPRRQVGALKKEAKTANIQFSEFAERVAGF
jgi:DNA-binding transcriptional MerR regulator